MEKEAVTEEYKLKRIVGRIKPKAYKIMIAHMDRIGISNEATYISMAITMLNDSLEMKKKEGGSI